jgi:histidyl-tRNA synthetase
LREHWQVNVDIFGSHSLGADAEVIAVAHAILTALGAQESDFTIKLGSRNFLDSVVRELSLSEEDAKKLRGLLDRRAKMPAEDFARDVSDIGVALEMLSPDKTPNDVAQVLATLNGLGINNAVFDPSIVRGFDYYTGVVFEIFDTHPDNNRAMLGGGRYDNLTELFGDEALPGVGFGMGDVTIKDFLESRGLLPDYIPPTKVYLAVAAPEFAGEAMRLADLLRKESVNTAVDFGDKKLGDQIKTASKHKIPYVIVIGSDELASGTFAVRDLATGEEKKLSRSELSAFFSNL